MSRSRVGIPSRAVKAMANRRKRRDVFLTPNKNVNRDMNILMICFVYNEVNYLPHVVNFWKNQGVNVYVIDNMSNDGTWEWMQENGIPSHRFDTQEMFELSWLQAEVTKTLKTLNPDWVIYGAADLYYGFDKSVKETIIETEKMGYNQITTNCCFAVNTGEKRKLPLMDNYFYCKHFVRVTMISKYFPEVIFRADKIMVPNARKRFVDGICINYGSSKSKEEQEVKLARRQKAWDNGLSKKWGVHYKSGKEIEWIYDRKDLFDIRNHNYWKYIEQIKIYADNNS